MEQLKKIIQDLSISEEEKTIIFQELKAIEKTITIAEFKYNRTVLDKAAITNVLNASIGEIDKQKKDIETANNEIKQNLIELDAQKKLIEEKNIELNKALHKLQSTQNQLIQAEKMASLGELTAGIAHEIQNPLNFVNNFSELSNEIIAEINEEIESGNTNEAKSLLKDVMQNLQKINNHGQRASNIVKAMLLHSRSSSGKKEPTDINALCDEYLRLAYHGFRAKDKSFNADYKLELDESLPKIDVVPEDIGRVLLNLINNAFYAVAKRAKEHPLPPSADGSSEENGQKYKPLVTISTSYSLSNGEGRGEVKISVKDNGPGIPPEIKNKIFQPFFTTKSTGEGTGLGLSLSYDIVKAHGGAISMESNNNEGVTFTITI